MRHRFVLLVLGLALFTAFSLTTNADPVEPPTGLQIVSTAITPSVISPDGNGIDDEAALSATMELYPTAGLVGAQNAAPPGQVFSFELETGWTIAVDGLPAAHITTNQLLEGLPTADAPLEVFLEAVWNGCDNAGAPLPEGCHAVTMEAVYLRTLTVIVPCRRS